jgi:PAS domain S-box-containing protein
MPVDQTDAGLRALLARAERLARIGSWEWDIPLNLVIWSDELYRIYGYEPRSFPPTYESFLERVHPDDRDAVDARNRKAFADHQPFEDVKRIVREDGTEFLMRTQGEVICDDDGVAVRMVGVCEDVTTKQSLPASRTVAVEIESEVVEPLADAGVRLARGEIEQAAAAIDEARRRARRIAEQLAGT